MKTKLLIYLVSFSLTLTASAISMTATSSFLHSGEEDVKDADVQDIFNEDKYDPTKESNDIFAPNNASSNSGNRSFNPLGLSPEELQNKNQAYAKEMNMNPDLMLMDKIDYKELHKDNIKYMHEEIGTTDWDPKNMNKYISYRNDVNIPRLLEGGLAVDQDGKYQGCNQISTFLSYLTHGKLLSKYLMEGDAGFATCNETAGFLRSGMYTNFYGSPYLDVDSNGNAVIPDFTVVKHLNASGGNHFDYYYNGYAYGGTGYPRSAQIAFEGGGAYNNIGGPYSTIAVYTYPEPFATPQEAANYYNLRLDEMAISTRNPLTSNYFSNSGNSTSNLDWQRTYQWMQERVNQEESTGINAHRPMENVRQYLSTGIGNYDKDGILDDF